MAKIKGSTVSAIVVYSPYSVTTVSDVTVFTDSAIRAVYATLISVDGFYHDLHAFLPRCNQALSVAKFTDFLRPKSTMAEITGTHMRQVGFVLNRNSR